eukprot:7865071-Karenia_brevis.AAC.1
MGTQTTDSASPLLFDAACQTGISVPKGLPEKFFIVHEAGHASPVSFETDAVAGPATLASEDAKNQ